MEQKIKIEYSGSEAIKTALDNLIKISDLELEYVDSGHGQIVVSAHLDDADEANRVLTSVLDGKYVVTYNKQCLSEDFIAEAESVKGHVFYNSAVAFCTAENLKYTNVSRKNIRTNLTYLDYSVVPTEDTLATHLFQDIDRAVNIIDPEQRRRIEDKINMKKWEAQQAAKQAALAEGLEEVAQPCGIDPTYE